MRPVAAAICAGLVALLAGCGADGDAAGSGGEGLPRVVATTNFITDTAQRVGGDRVEVEGLMGPGVDPHLYQPSAGDVATLRGADAILYGGLELEGRMGDLLARLGESEVVVAVTDGIPRELLIDAGPEESGEYDPHVWFDPDLWRYAVEGVRETLSEIDPEGAEHYERNAERMLADLDELAEYGRREIATIPAERRVLVTSHDAFEYFGRAFDIDVEAIQGISTQAEASTADIERVARVVAERGVKAVFIESSVPRQTIDAVVAAAERLGGEANVGGELYSDAAGDAGTEQGTYVGMVRANIEAIVEGLR